MLIDVVENSVVFLVENSCVTEPFAKFVREELIAFLHEKSSRGDLARFKANVGYFDREFSFWADQATDCTMEAALKLADWIRAWPIATLSSSMRSTGGVLFSARRGPLTLPALIMALNDPFVQAVYLFSSSVPQESTKDLLDHVKLASKGRPVHVTFLTAHNNVEYKAMEILHLVSKETGGAFKVAYFSSDGRLERCIRGNQNSPSFATNGSELADQLRYSSNKNDTWHGGNSELERILLANKTTNVANNLDQLLNYAQLSQPRSSSRGFDDLRISTHKFTGNHGNSHSVWPEAKKAVVFNNLNTSYNGNHELMAELSRLEGINSNTGNSYYDRIKHKLDTEAADVSGLDAVKLDEIKKLFAEVYIHDKDHNGRHNGRDADRKLRTLKAKAYEFTTDKNGSTHQLTPSRHRHGSHHSARHPRRHNSSGSRSRRHSSRSSSGSVSNCSTCDGHDRSYSPALSDGYHYRKHHRSPHYRGSIGGVSQHKVLSAAPISGQKWSAITGLHTPPPGRLRDSQRDKTRITPHSSRPGSTTPGRSSFQRRKMYSSKITPASLSLNSWRSLSSSVNSAKQQAWRPPTARPSSGFITQGLRPPGDARTTLNNPTDSRTKWQDRFWNDYTAKQNRVFGTGFPERGRLQRGTVRNPNTLAVTTYTQTPHEDARPSSHGLEVQTIRDLVKQNTRLMDALENTTAEPLTQREKTLQLQSKRNRVLNKIYAAQHAARERKEAGEMAKLYEAKRNVNDEIQQIAMARQLGVTPRPLAAVASHLPVPHHVPYAPHHVADTYHAAPYATETQQQAHWPTMNQLGFKKSRDEIVHEQLDRKEAIKRQRSQANYKAMYEKLAQDVQHRQLMASNSSRLAGQKKSLAIQTNVTSDGQVYHQQIAPYPSAH